jgi:virginiamycin A acetyltransferase
MPNVMGVKFLLRHLIPSAIRRLLRLWNNKRRFRTSRINTHSIGSNVRIGHHCKIQMNVRIEGDVTIGDYSYVNDNTMIGRHISIGKYCSIAYNCQIGMNEHPIQFITTSPYMYGSTNILDEPEYWNDFSEPITIGNDVWVGSNAIILQGVTIGDGAIIAAGAVVTKSVKPYEVVGGVPAQLIRTRFPEKQIESLLKLRWWDMSEEELKKNKILFTSKEEWYKHIND